MPHIRSFTKVNTYRRCQRTRAKFKMFLLIDNYDSFTYNLLHFMGELDAEVLVKRNDSLSVKDALNLEPEGIVISPGPCGPESAGISVELIRKAAGYIPVLGVCLGHQSLGQAFGAKIIRAPAPMHGKVSDVNHSGLGVFAGIPSPFKSTRYHSLLIERNTLPDCLKVTAEADNGLIMGIEHKEHPLIGVQFHPESIATEYGHKLLKNFIDMTSEKK